MTDAGFFRGTSADQDNRFSNKNKKLLKQLKFSDVLNHKVDLSKINRDVIENWIKSQITKEIDDEVLYEYIINQLYEKNFPDGKNMQINLTGFLGGKPAREFMDKLWTVLLDGMQTEDGIPKQLLDEKMEEIKRREAKNEKANGVTADDNDKKERVSKRSRSKSLSVERTKRRNRDNGPKGDEKNKRDRSLSRSYSKSRSKSSSRSVERKRSRSPNQRNRVSSSRSRSSSPRYRPRYLDMRRRYRSPFRRRRSHSRSYSPPYYRRRFPPYRVREFHKSRRPFRGRSPSPRYRRQRSYSRSPSRSPPPHRLSSPKNGRRNTSVTPNRSVSPILENKNFVPAANHHAYPNPSISLADNRISDTR